MPIKKVDDFRLRLPLEFSISQKDLDSADEAVEVALRRFLKLDRLEGPKIYVDESHIAFDLHNEDSPNHRILPLTWKLKWWIIGYRTCKRMWPIRIYLGNTFADIAYKREKERNNDNNRKALETHKRGTGTGSRSVPSRV